MAPDGSRWLGWLRLETQYAFIKIALFLLRDIGISGDRYLAISGYRDIWLAGDRGIGIVGDRGVWILGNRDVGISVNRGIGGIVKSGYRGIVAESLLKFLLGVSRWRHSCRDKTCTYR